MTPGPDYGRPEPPPTRNRVEVSIRHIPSEVSEALNAIIQLSGKAAMWENLKGYLESQCESNHTPQVLATYRGVLSYIRNLEER